MVRIVPPGPQHLVATPEAEVLGYFESLRNWGRWGPDDELGTLNFIRPEHRRQAAGLVVDGATVSCERLISTSYSEDNAQPLLHFMIATGESAPSSGQAAASDWLGMAFHGHGITHLDSLGHFFWDGKMYNGRSAGVVTAAGGVGFGSIEPACHGLVSRGVLLDIPGVRGEEYLQPGAAISVEDLERCEADAGIVVGTADMLLIRTGRDPRRRHHPVAAGRPGLTASCLPWLHEREVSMLISDEVHDVAPAQYAGIRTPIHAVAIVAMGLWLLDNAQLEQLAEACAERRRWEFMMVVAPLLLEHASGSPVNPMAVF
jgi:kynurenine formamidase